MCGVVYTPSAVNKKTKVNGVTTEREAPTTGGRVEWIWGTSGDTYMEESKVGSELNGDIGVLGLWDPRRMCVFNVCVVDTDLEYYYGIHLQKSCLSMSGTKRENILRIYLRDNAPPRRLCYLWTG